MHTIVRQRSICFALCLLGTAVYAGLAVCAFWLYPLVGLVVHLFFLLPLCGGLLALLWLIWEKPLTRLLTIHTTHYYLANTLVPVSVAFALLIGIWLIQFRSSLGFVGVLLSSGDLTGWTLVFFYTLLAAVILSVQAVVLFFVKWVKRKRPKQAE